MRDVVVIVIDWLIKLGHKAGFLLRCTFCVCVCVCVWSV